MEPRNETGERSAYCASIYDSNFIRDLFIPETGLKRIYIFLGKISISYNFF